MSKIVLIGLDGASWPVIDYLLRDNKLPTFKRLINNGVRKTLYNVSMINVDPWQIFYMYREYRKKIPRLGTHHEADDWTTLATGVMPDRHGVVASTETNIQGMELPVSRRNKKKPTVWEIITRHNKKIGVIGWVANWPPSSLPYYTVTRISDVFHSFGGVGTYKPSFNNGFFLCNPTYPKRLWKDLLRIDYDREIDGFIQRIPAVTIGLELVHDSLYIEWAKYLLEKFPQPDFLAICLHGIHTLSHVFWDCLEIEKSNFKGAVHQNRQRKFGYIIEDYYRYLDKKISEVFSLIDKDSIVVIVSDHGMTSSRITKKYLLMDRIYEKLGLLRFKNGKIDWRNTQVYDNINRWGIFAIRKGFIRHRYPQNFFKKFKKLMRGIKTEKNEPLFLGVDFNKDDNSFTVVPNYKAIHYSTKVFLNNNVFPARELINFIPHYSLHDPEGIFIISGRDMQHCNVIESMITTLDIAPTIFDLLGIQHKDTDIKGRVIFKIKAKGGTNETRTNIGKICNA